MLLGPKLAIYCKLFADNGVIAFNIARTPGHTGIETTGGTVCVDSSSNFTPNFAFGHTVYINGGYIYAANHRQLTFSGMLNPHDIVLGNNALPDIDSDIYHIVHDRLAYAVCMMHIYPARIMDSVGDFSRVRFNKIPPNSRRQKKVLLTTPIILIEKYIRMVIFCSHFDLADLIVANNRK